ncbi:RagB/SusD family nutrient uptake outer membrane protein [Thermoflavifilum thermophilum]|uniref:Starch-binding associating with outer membrane n=1 Tax=Thermoflavifilum thermophilum TaxID=1393122 RepID=A0A1I7NIU0_9BACT|nr:RagB/SusD family nutrient uptake outer membrane protein [Thermoflavifilum thermophilum]SFV34584.1 Starch-binding associating with outer membrane [Thermoflavifilum thermophilum]
MKHILFILLLFILIAGFTSCKKWLDVKPQDGIIRNNYWKTKEQLQAAVIGIYASLLDNSLVQDLFVWGELRGDMVVSTQFTSNDEINIMQDNILPSNSYTDWSPIYRTINYCNTVIDFGPSVLQNDPTLTEDQLNAYLAEAYAIRGLMYFYLLRTFGEVPLQLKATSSDSLIQRIPKSTQQEVYNQVMNDLHIAQIYAPYTYGDRNEDKGRITRYTVFAIEADTYLWMDQYDSCIAMCDSIINSQRFGLVDGTNQAEWFNTLYYQGNSVESIFEFQFDQQKLNPFYNLLISGTRHFVAAPTVMDEVFGIDMTDPNNKDIRGDGGSVNAIDGTIWKYAGATSGSTMIMRTSDQSYAHWFVYRYADILLMKAEALAWVGRGQEALDLINMIRTRAHALDYTAESPDPNSPEDISTYILDERAREFAYEGKRWFDILRICKRNNYELINLLLNAVTKNVPGYLQQTVMNKYKDVRSHYLPINQNELLVDPNLKQNPFYQ